MNKHVATIAVILGLSSPSQVLAEDDAGLWRVYDRALKGAK